MDSSHSTDHVNQISRGNGETARLQNSMDMDHMFKQAAVGNFQAFQGQKDQLLQLVTCVHKDTVLHIHLTARYQYDALVLDMYFGRESPYNSMPYILLTLVNPLRYLSLIARGILWGILKKSSTSAASVGFVKKVVRECSDMLWATNAKSETLLHLAARYGHNDIVQLLLRKCREAQDQEAARNRKMLGMVNKSGDTALHEAVFNNYPRVVKILIDEEPSYSYGPNKDGKTPLYIAAERGNIQVVSLILDSSSASPLAYQGPDSKTALHAAVLHNSIGITRMLAKKLKDLTKEADKSGMIPLHYAAQEGFFQIVTILLQEDKSAAYIGNNKDDDMTALHMAAKYRRANVMWQIMSQCPHSCEQVDNKGRNLLHFVVEGNSKRTLIAALSNPFVKLKLVNEEDNEGNRPLEKLTFNFLSHFDPYFTVFQRPPNKTLDRLFVGLREGLDRSKYGDKDDIDHKRRETGTGGESENDRRGTQLLVAALTATVTFAAAFTMPGGYLTDKGTPVLIKSVAFIVFIVADITSLMLSSFAVFIHFRFIIFEQTKQVDAGLTAAVGATSCALIMMVVAFCAGAYAVLSPSGSWLATLCYVLPIALAYILVMFTELLINLQLF